MQYRTILSRPRLETQKPKTQIWPLNLTTRYAPENLNRDLTFYTLETPTQKQKQKSKQSEKLEFTILDLRFWNKIFRKSGKD